MADFAEFLRNDMSKGEARLEKAKAFTAELIQAAKNSNAPVIAGGNAWSGNGTTFKSAGGAGGSTSAYLGAANTNLNLPTMKGGKVLPVSGRVSQNWGKSRIKYAAGRHTGMDFGVKSGSRVGAVAAGTVVRAGSEGAYGNAIHVRHADGTTSLYAHLSGLNVKAGQKVKAGQQIALSGNTGRSFGAHLHFEIRKSDKYGGDINPNSWYSSR